MTDELQPDEPEPIEYRRAVGQVGTSFECPHCNAMSWVPGMRGLVHIGHGGVMRLRCSKCDGGVEVWAGEQPRIAQPDQIQVPNRQQRRAQRAMKPRIIIP